MVTDVLDKLYLWKTYVFADHLKTLLVYAPRLVHMPSMFKLLASQEMKHVAVISRPLASKTECFVLWFPRTPCSGIPQPSHLRADRALFLTLKTLPWEAADTSFRTCKPSWCVCVLIGSPFYLQIFFFFCCFFFKFTSHFYFVTAS